MSENQVSRREVMASIAAAALAGTLPAEAAQHVHQAAAESRTVAGVYKPKGLSAGEFQSLGVLCELIVPGARQAAAAEFIDTLCSGSKAMAAIYTGGLAWMNAEMRRRYEVTFVAAKPEQQKALLDLIAYAKNASAELNPGIQFFDWARRMTVDAYFTSKVGIAELGFQGNSSMQTYTVPVESIEYVKKRSELV